MNVSNKDPLTVFNTESVYIGNLNKIPLDYMAYKYYRQKLEACVEFKKRWPYDPAFVHDLKFLIQITLDSIHKSQAKGESSIDLKNLCCNVNGTCAQMDFRRLFIDQLRVV